MIVDFDDYCEGNHRLDLLEGLRAANPAFRCTLFAIPALGGPRFWDATPDWCELAMHGWQHGEPAVECALWSAERMREAIAAKPERFVCGFKAPGWQISAGCYEALLEADWWVADQPYNDHRRPPHLRVHRLGEGDHWHGHIQNVCGNGLEETYAQLRERVASASEFRLVSEVAETMALV